MGGQNRHRQNEIFVKIIGLKIHTKILVHAYRMMSDLLTRIIIIIHDIQIKNNFL